MATKTTTSDGSRRRAKDALFEGFASIGRALSSGRRVEIVDVLAQGERSVEVLARELGQTIANTSHHLRTLAAAGLVTWRREGSHVFYSLASEDVATLWEGLQGVARLHVGNLEKLAAAYLGDRDSLESITGEELARRLRRGEVTVIDVRPKPEYSAGHIAGAQWVPPGEIKRFLRGLDDDAEVVAYCRGSYCVFADDAVRELRRRGVTARRLEGGFPEWRRAGLPVAKD
jgi:rhodanese-related sulfurtransferase